MASTEKLEIKATADVGNAVSGLNQLDSKINNLSSSFQSLATKGIQAFVGMKVVNAITEFTKSTIDAAAEMEALKMGLISVT
jgi:UDP-glucose 6-dehydrogenase